MSGTIDEPLAGYEGETTGDYRAAVADDDGDGGVYESDLAAGDLTAAVAQAATRRGGRIPAPFRDDRDSEGDARQHTWTVYAPADNPYAIASAVVETLQQVDAIEDVNVHIHDHSPQEAAARLGDILQARLPDDVDADAVHARYVRESRWESGLDAGARNDLRDDPSDAREAIWALLEDAPDSVEADIGDLAHDIVQQAGDAWTYRKVTIHADERAAAEEYR